MDMDDGIIPEQEISDPQGLLEAVTYDSLVMLKEGLTRDTYDDHMHKIHHPWDSVTDKDIFRYTSISPTYFKDALYKEGKPNEHAYLQSYWYIHGLRALAPGLLYMLLQNVCEERDDKLILKDGCKVTVSMY